MQNNISFTISTVWKLYEILNVVLKILRHLNRFHKTYLKRGITNATYPSHKAWLVLLNLNSNEYFAHKSCQHHSPQQQEMNQWLATRHLLFHPVCLFQPFLSAYILPKQLYKCALQLYLLKIGAYLEQFTFSLWLIINS